MTPPEKKPRYEGFRSASLLLAIPALLIASPLVGLFAGMVADRWLKTGRVFTAIGIVLGFATAGGRPTASTGGSKKIRNERSAKSAPEPRGGSIMGLEVLTRVRKSSLWGGGFVALLIGRYVGWPHGLAAELGGVWSLLNLALIQRLVVALTGPDKATRPALRSAAISIGGMVPLFAAGAVMLAKLPPQSLLVGFLIPFAVIVLKAVSLLILGSGLW